MDKGGMEDGEGQGQSGPQFVQEGGAGARVGDGVPCGGNCGK